MKEAIIRYLGQVGWGNRQQITEAIKAKREIVSRTVTDSSRISSAILHFPNCTSI
jgi:hypothetical protein